MSFYVPGCELLYADIRKSIDSSIQREQKWLARKPKWWQFEKRKVWLTEKPNQKEKVKEVIFIECSV